MQLTQVNLILSSLVLLSQIFIVVILAYLLFLRKYQTKASNFISKNAIPLAFLVVLIATLGSLYYSGIAKFIPCELCWFQRIFMYPQVILLGLAWIKKDNQIVDYSLATVGLGTLISLYHNYIYYSAKPSDICSIVAPCTQQYITGFNYISIPLMALTAFILVGLLLLNKKIKKV